VNRKQNTGDRILKTGIRRTESRNQDSGDRENKSIKGQDGKRTGKEL